MEKRKLQNSKNVASKAAMKKKRAGVRLFKAMLLTCLVAIILCIAGGGLFIKKMIDDAPDITPEDVKPSKFTTQALADDGTTVLDTFVDAGANRVYKSIDDPKRSAECICCN